MRAKKGQRVPMGKSWFGAATLPRHTRKRLRMLVHERVRSESPELLARLSSIDARKEHCRR